MLNLLALAIQTASPPAPAADPAMKCAFAVVGANGEAQPSLQGTAHFMYFVMQAAKADSGGKPFLARVNELAAGLDRADVPAEPAAKALLASCDRAYPLARATTPAPRLPAKAFDRDVMCLGALSILKGAAEEMRGQGPDGGAAARIDTILGPLLQRFDDAALAAQGIDGEAAFVAAMGTQLEASLALGNSQMIARACGVTGI